MSKHWDPSGEINVRYRFLDGHHIFTSDQVDGLYVASADPRKAYDDVIHAIRMLVLVNDGVSIRVRKPMTLKNFLQYVRQAGPNGPEPKVFGNAYEVRAA